MLMCLGYLTITSLPGRRRDKIIIEGICHDTKVMADNLTMQGLGTSATTLLDELYISLQTYI